MSKISIALATYNGATYLPELLDSLSRQSLAADEIIAVDDCSKDDTIKILQKYSKKLPIRIIVNESNLGVNKNFEKAVKESKGDYILICDQDDVWFENNIEEKISALRKLAENKPALVASRSIVTDSKLNILQKRHCNKDIVDFQELFTKYFQGTTMAFNRLLVEKLSMQWPVQFKEFPYDQFLYLTALLTGNVCVLSKSLMYYRTHKNNASLKISALHNALKKLFPTAKLYQDYLTIQSLKNMEQILLNVKNSGIPERILYAESLVNCKKDNRINWIQFLGLKKIPLNIRIRTLAGSFFFFLKKIV